MNDKTKEDVDVFDKNIKKIINLLETNKEEEARLIFNRDLYEKYNKVMWDKENILSLFSVFFFNLDKYLNNKDARTLGFSKKEDVIGSYYSDYQDDLRSLKNKGNI